MPGFVLKELLLLSLKEKTARRIPFDAKTTVIKGSNQTGKSCLIKSIYRCFGATPQNIHPRWKDAKVHGVITFELNDVTYRILEEGKRYTVFDANNNVINGFESVTSGMGPFIANLLGFLLRLPDRANQLRTPPPAYIFLPFYVDQDAGWSQAWNSFARLNQFSNWKKALAEYYTGIKPNEYYWAKGEAEALQLELKPLLDKHAVLRAVLLDLERRLKLAEFSLDIEKYSEEIRELLIHCDGLRKKEEEIKTDLVKYYNQKTVLEAQVAIARNTLNELHEDYEFITTKLQEDHVDCPTCGQGYSNDFFSRFAIAKDEDRCHELLSELSDDLEATNRQIEAGNRKYSDVSADIANVNAILQRKQGEVQLKDLIESEGRREVQNIVRKDLGDLAKSISELEEQIRILRARMEAFDNKEHRQEVTRQFRASMREFLFDLEVHTLPYNRLTVDSRINETGSDTPRALLAYYFSILRLLQKFSTSTFCPIVIDSPNQQDQDAVNLKKMLDFIRKSRPEDSQLVLAMVDDSCIDFGGKVIELTEKYSLLLESEFEDVGEEVRPLLSKSVAYFQMKT